MARSDDDDMITPAPRPETGHANKAQAESSKDEFAIDFNEKGASESGKFAFSPYHLQKLNDARSPSALCAFGGLDGLANGLRTDARAGLGADEDVLDGIVMPEAAISAARAHKAASIRPSETTADVGLVAKVLDLDSLDFHEKPKGYTDRRSTYGVSRLPKPRERSLLSLAWLAFNDKLIFLLTASNIVSLALGIYAAVAPGNENDSGAKLEWIEGVTIAVAIIVIVFGQAINDKIRNKKFVKLNEKKQDRDVAVIRSGKTVMISVFDILVGDLVRLETGDVVPADGILVDGFAIKCDESPLTGESDLVAKRPAREVEAKGEGDCFVQSGTSIEHGVGTYLVTAVGIQSVYGRIKMSLRNDVEETPLQNKLGRLAKQIILTGFVVGTIFFTILFIRWLVRLKDFLGSARDKGESFLDIFMLSVTVVVIGVPEGLSLAVAVALAFATTRMLKDNNLVRLLRSCETMGNATTICSDKTGTLTQNKMTVVAGVVGARYNLEEEGSKLMGNVTAEIKELFKQNIALNSTAFEKGGPGSGEFIGSSTEKALLSFGHEHLAMGPLAEERENTPPVHLFPFNADRKCMATVIVSGEKYRMLVKGAPEVILPHCSVALDSPEVGVEAEPLMAESRGDLSSVARGFSSQMLRPIAIAYRDFESWPPVDAITDKDSTNTGPAEESETVNFSKVFADLTFAGILAIRDPLRPEVIESVRQCQNAGVFVRMVTGDAFETARAIASECGIYTAGGIALDGPTFRKLTSAQLDLILPRLQVLARSNPNDKERLVRHLKKLGETVAVTGDGTNDAYALKAADVGFAMGISGTEVAKEASSIILMDDNFSSIVKALAWGRTVLDAAKKFIQFQFTINITAAWLTIFSALIKDVDEAVFAVIHLLWLNLLMDILAAAALATDPPTSDILKRQPEPRNVHIVSPTMWKMIIGQAAYQLAVIFSLHYAGKGYFTPNDTRYQHQAFVFNTYIFLQVFNQWNCRRPDNNLNFFTGVLRNPWFLLVQTVTIGGQIIIIFKGGDAFKTEPLTGAQWGWSIFFGSMTLPLGAAIRMVPDSFLVNITKKLRPISGAIPKLRRRKKTQVREEKEPREKNDIFFEDLGNDEERRVRRFQWRWWKKSKAEKDGVAAAIAEAGMKLGGRNVEVIFEKGIEKRGTGLSGANEDDGEAQLFRLIETAKNAPGEVPYGLEVHPATGKGDPVLMKGVADRGPPSQNPEVRQYLGMSE
ncbi:hypothetical protein OQA88_11799 [Cercophora sp. LCS_1]